MIRAAIVGLGWWGRNIVESVHDKSDQAAFLLLRVVSPK